MGRTKAHFPAVVPASTTGKTVLMLYDTLVFMLIPSAGKLKENQRRRMSQLSPIQRQAISSFLNTLGASTSSWTTPLSTLDVASADGKTNAVRFAAARRVGGPQSTVLRRRFSVLRNAKE